MASFKVAILLWLSFLLFLVHGWSSFSSGNAGFSTPGLVGNRKALSLSAEIDFVSLRSQHKHRVHHHHHHYHHHQQQQQGEPDPHEIDPRYGVEKRLVPTGPNPLHH